MVAALSSRCSWIAAPPWKPKTALARAPAQHLSATWLRNQGQTALHWAAYCCHLPVIELLVRNGAILDVKEMDGRVTWVGILTLRWYEQTLGATLD